MTDFFGVPTMRTARTMHVCSVCFRKIEAGERYTIAKSYLDGWYEWRTCTHCEAAYQTAWNLRLLDGEWDGQSLFDVLSDWTVTTARMAVGLRRKWVAFCGYRLLPVPAVIPRRCVERGCADSVDAPRSYTWCERHDAQRIERVSRQLAEIAASFEASPERVS